MLLLCVAVLALASCASDAKRGLQPAATHRSLASTTSAAPPPAATSVRTFTPYSAGGALSVRTAGHARGSCFAGSAAAPVAGAYRCFAGNALLDPCFARARSSTTVACLESPWAGATVLTLTAALPAVQPVGSGRAWALQLDDGTRCVASTGTVPAVAGVDLAYRCSNGGAAAVVDPAAARVVARFAAKGATTLQQRTVAVLWHG